MSLAPIVLFAYKRPLHTKATLDALSNNTLAKQSQLFVYIDGLKDSATSEDIVLHQQVISMANSINCFAKTKVIISDSNKGLAKSVIDGVTQIVNEFKKVIVLEDDLVTSPLFLEFMNEALFKYESEKDVACISGYIYPLKQNFDKAFFLRGADCWGWATWEDKWNAVFENNPEALYRELNERSLINEFNFNGSYPYSEMLEDRIKGENQSWAVLWYASAFLKNKYCLYPSKSFVHNIGNDGTGTHTQDPTNKFDANLNQSSLPIFPDIIAENRLARTTVESFFKELTGRVELSVTQKIKNKLKTLIGR